MNLADNDYSEGQASSYPNVLNTHWQERSIRPTNEFGLSDERACCTMLTMTSFQFRSKVMIES